MIKKTIVLMVLALAGCDKLKSDSSTTGATSTTTATATVTANEILTATVTATTAAPTVTATATASSATAGGWPLPDYPGAKVTKKTSDFVSLETKDAPDKVVTFYKDKLKAAGFPPGPWASLAGAPKDQPTVMTASKGAQMVQVTVTPIQGTTKISVSSM